MNKNLSYKSLLAVPFSLSIFTSPLLLQLNVQESTTNLETSVSSYVLTAEQKQAFYLFKLTYFSFYEYFVTDYIFYKYKSESEFADELKELELVTEKASVVKKLNQLKIEKDEFTSDYIKLRAFTDLENETYYVLPYI